MSISTIENDIAGFFGNAKADLKEMEPILDKLLTVMVGLAPAADLGATVTGNAGLVPLINTAASIAKAGATAIEADEAAGSTGSTLVTGAATVANTVADSGLVNTTAASQIKTDTVSVQQVLTAVQTDLSGSESAQLQQS